MNKLAAQIAKCSISCALSDIPTIFMNKTKVAYKEQLACGYKATWYKTPGITDEQLASI